MISPAGRDGVLFIFLTLEITIQLPNLHVKQLGINLSILYPELRGEK